MTIWQNTTDAPRSPQRVHANAVHGAFSGGHVEAAANAIRVKPALHISEWTAGDHIRSHSAANTYESIS